MMDIRNPAENGLVRPAVLSHESLKDPVANAAFNPAKVVFSADRRYVATASADDVSVWELMTGHYVARMAPMYPVVSVAFSPGGEYLVTGSGSDVFARHLVRNHRGRQFPA